MNIYVYILYTIVRFCFVSLDVTVIIIIISEPNYT